MPPFDPLSEHALTILPPVAAGNVNKKVAKRLSISPDAAKAHMK
jgi:FixJ family two-component response regulator